MKEPVAGNIIKKFQFESQSILSGLTHEESRFFEDNITYKTYKRGKTIFLEDSFPPGIYFVASGLVKKYKTFDGDKEQIIYVCSKGEFFGYTAVLSDEPYPDSAQTLTDCEIGFLQKDIFLKFVENSPNFSIRLLKNLSHEYGVMANNVVSHAGRSVRERLAIALIVLNKKFSNAFPQTVPTEIRLSRCDLSNIVGSATETLVRTLNELKNEKLIALNGKSIVVIDHKNLIKIAKI